MKRRSYGGLWGVALVALFAASPAMARGLQDEIVTQLKRSGFSHVAVEKTFLGRVRITATRKGGSREIVINPRTGEVLRDLWLDRAGRVNTTEVVDNNVFAGATGDDTDDAQTEDAKDDKDTDESGDDKSDKDKTDKSDSDSDKSDSDSDKSDSDSDKSESDNDDD